MAVFKNPEDTFERVDWKILQDGWANLYWKSKILENDLDWFRKENFDVKDFDCSNWNQAKNIHYALKQQLHFPDYYGENLNALNDCLSDLQIDEYGFVVCFRHFDVVDKDIAHGLLDVFAKNARLHLLFGKKVLMLIQVDDPKYQIDPIGACTVSWNSSEWLNRTRGL
jgi:RNAse (barnase) inhibitor barstar